MTVESRAVEEHRLVTELVYREREPVEVLIRRRGRRYDIGDGAAGVEAAGRPSGWLDVARGVVEEASLNVNRRGVIFVPAVEGRDIYGLAIRVAETSRAVYLELLERADAAHS